MILGKSGPELAGIMAKQLIEGGDIQGWGRLERRFPARKHFFQHLRGPSNHPLRIPKWKQHRHCGALT
jgi:hypothetical protein